MTGYIPINFGIHCVRIGYGCTIPNCQVCGLQYNKCSVCSRGYYRQKNPTTGYV